MAKLNGFRPATRNANRHTQRGLKALQDSMRQVGYTEPMVAAADGEMLSGSARIESVADVFGLDVEPIVVRSDGTRPVIHVREDIPNAQTPEAQKIALAANRVAELDLAWDVEVLAGFDADVLDGLWSPYDLSKLGEQWADMQGDDPNEHWKGMPEFEQEDVFGAVTTIKVHFATEEDIARFAKLLGQTVTKDSVYIWFPKQQRENLKAYVAHDES